MRQILDGVGLKKNGNKKEELTKLKEPETEDMNKKRNRGQTVGENAKESSGAKERKQKGSIKRVQEIM